MCITPSYLGGGLSLAKGELVQGEAVQRGADQAGQRGAAAYGEEAGQLTLDCVEVDDIQGAEVWAQLWSST